MDVFPAIRVVEGEGKGLSTWKDWKRAFAKIFVWGNIVTPLKRLRSML